MADNTIQFPGGGNEGLPPPPSEPSITPDDLHDLDCPACKHKLFDQKFLIKKISKIVSPDGREHIIPIPVLVCSKCETIISELPMPPGQQQ